MTDREFCSDDHRRRGRLPSASVMRDLEYESDPLWEAAYGAAQRKAQTKSNTSMAAVLVMGVGLIVAARFWFPEDKDVQAQGPPDLTRMLPNSRPLDRGPDVAVGVGPGGVYGWLQNHLSGDKPVVVQTDFRKGLDEWVDGGGRGPAWSSGDGGARPGRLQFWKPTLKSANYDVAFRGAIEKKAMGWAFRAKDSSNYYATKIILHRPGEVSGAAIQRIVMENAQRNLGAELPLSLKLEKDRSYQIAFVVRGNRFSTLLDGQVIDEWTDNRHKTGGVGFFTEEGEAARISWVSFVERKSIFGRLFASAFLLPPGAVPE